MIKRALLKFIKNDEIVFFVLFFIMVLPLFWLSLYNHPCRDDYTETMLVWDKGFWIAQKFWYNNWTGRYLASFIISLNPMVFGAYWGYKLNAIVLILLMVIASYFLMSQVSQKHNKRIKLILFTSFLFSQFFLMPDIAQGVFWQAHAFAGYVGTVLSVFLLGCVIKFYRTNTKIYLVLTCVLCGGVIGSYEIFMVITDLASLLLVFYFLAKRTFNRPAWIILLACITFSVIEIIAPGNKIRESLLPNSHHFMFSVFNAIKYGAYFTLLWLPISIVVLVILYDYIAKQIAAGNFHNAIFNVHPIYPLIFCFCVPVIGFFTGFWALGERPPLRGINIIQFYFLVSSFYFLLCFAHYSKEKYKFSLPARVKIAAYVALVGLVFFTGNNLTRAYHDLLTGNAQKFDEQMTLRNNFLIGFKGDSCSIKAIKNIPKTIFFAEPDTTEGDYKAFCSYYKKKCITIK